MKDILKKKAYFKLKGIRTIYSEQSIELTNDVPTVLFGLNGAGKSSILKGISSINKIDSGDKTTFLRIMESYEENNYLYEDKIIAEASITIPFTIKELETIKSCLEKIEFTKENISEYIGEFSNNGRTIGSNTNGNNFVGLFEDFDGKDTTMKRIILSFLDKEKKIVSEILGESIDSYSKILEENIDKVFISFYEKGLITKSTNAKITLLKKVVEILKIKPHIINISKAADEGNIDFKYNLGELFIDEKSSNNKKIKDIFNFMCPDMNILRQYYNETPDTDKKAKLKSYLISKINDNIIDLLEKFNVNFIIKVDIEGNEINLQFLGKDNWLIGNNKGTNESEGNKAFLEFIIMISSILKKIENYGNVILIADEPEKNLSLSLQCDLRKYMLKKLKDNKKGNLFIIYATHSPVMFNTNFNNYSITRKYNGATKIQKIGEVDDFNNMDIWKLTEMSKVFEDDATRNLKKLSLEKKIYYSSDEGYLDQPQENKYSQEFKLVNIDLFPDGLFMNMKKDKDKYFFINDASTKNDDFEEFKNSDKMEAIIIG